MKYPVPCLPYTCCVSPPHSQPHTHPAQGSLQHSVPVAPTIHHIRRCWTRSLWWPQPLPWGPLLPEPLLSFSAPESGGWGRAGRQPPLSQSPCAHNVLKYVFVRWVCAAHVCAPLRAYLRGSAFQNTGARSKSSCVRIFLLSCSPPKNSMALNCLKVATL